MRSDRSEIAAVAIGVRSLMPLISPSTVYLPRPWNTLHRDRIPSAFLMLDTRLFAMDCICLSMAASCDFSPLTRPWAADTPAPYKLWALRLPVALATDVSWEYCELIDPNMAAEESARICAF